MKVFSNHARANPLCTDSCLHNAGDDARHIAEVLNRTIEKQNEIIEALNMLLAKREEAPHDDE